MPSSNFQVFCYFSAEVAYCTDDYLVYPLRRMFSVYLGGGVAFNRVNTVYVETIEARNP